MLEPLQLIQKYQSLKGERGMTETLWQDCMDHCNPRKNNITYEGSPGEKKYTDLLDTTAMTNCELLAGALHGMLTNPAGFFFGLSTGVPEIDQNDEVRKWLQETVRIMHDTLNNTNFQTEVHETYLDLTSIGNAAMLTEEDEETDVRFSAKPIQEIFVDENSKGQVDCVYRCYKMDARGLVDDFGIDVLPKKIQDAYKKGKSDKFEVLHAVYPKPKDKKYKKGEYKVFAFISQYVLVAEKQTLETKGFYELPYQVPRWSKASGEKYGRGCGEKALGPSKSLQKMRETVLRGAQKVVDPPLQAPDDGFMSGIVIKPAGINYYRAGTNDRIEPILNDSRIDFGFQTIDQERMQVREAFYSDQLKLREGPQMTATEVAERVEQALRFLGPMLGRLQNEFLQPLIERVYNILDRKGKIPAAPAQVAGKKLKVQYTSVIAMQQRMSEIQNIRRTMQEIAPFTAADPTVLDNINGDQAIKTVAKLLNFPQEILRDAKDVQAIREQRAQQQQAALEAAQQSQQVDSASKLVGAAAKSQKAG